MMDGSKYGNEWHEQVSFSDLYFQITNACRGHQYKWQVIEWKGCLFSKISLIAGIFKEKEFEPIKDEMGNVDKINLKEINQLYKALFKLEILIDQKMNVKMPFLNIKKQDDIRGL